jgi:hypothetical protein
VGRDRGDGKVGVGRHEMSCRGVELTGERSKASCSDISSAKHASEAEEGELPRVRQRSRSPSGIV